MQKKSLAPLRFIFQFLAPYKKALAGAMVALTFTAGITLTIGQGVRMIIDDGFIGQSTQGLNQAVGFVATLILFMAVGSFVRFYLVSWLGERVSADIRKKVFNHLISLHPGYFEENKSGDIMSRLTTDTTLLQSIIGSSVSMALRNTLTLTGGLIMLVVTNVKLTLIVLIAVPLVLLPMKLFGKRVRTLSRASQDSVADIGTYAGEAIRNVKVVQSYNRQDFEQSAFGGEVDNAFSIAKRRILQRAMLISMVIVLVFSAITGMLWVGGQDVLNGTISGGELAAFVFYAIIVASAVGTISEVYGELQRAAGASERLAELLAEDSEINETTTPAVLPEIENEQSIIDFDNVDFSYPSRPDIKALEGINLSVKKGQVVAIVGPSGAGKTTLFELLQRFYDPQQGQIKLHGVELAALSLDTVRAKMGLVPQHPVLFSTDVYQNIRYGKQDAEREEIENAATKAHAAEFIDNLPEKYESDLGEQGVRLSGGQKQRIAIARAILKDPEILLLDEATSALDAESEHHVQAALNELMKQRTTLIIAHRLATVMHADEIIVMDKGKVVASGSHDALLKSSPLYQRLCKLQFDYDAGEQFDQVAD